jgi:hypothetical protein
LQKKRYKTVPKSFRKSVPHIAAQWKMKAFRFTNVTDLFQIRLTFVAAEYESWEIQFVLFLNTVRYKKTLPEIID